MVSVFLVEFTEHGRHRVASIRVAASEDPDSLRERYGLCAGHQVKPVGSWQLSRLSRDLPPYPFQRAEMNI